MTIANAGGDQQAPYVSIVISPGDPSLTLMSARSVLAQTLVSLELIVPVLDSQTEDDAQALQLLARDDTRVRVVTVSAAEIAAYHENRWGEIARGWWVGTLGCGDLMHPERLAKLLAAVERDGADIVYDNALLFDDANEIPPSLAVTGRLTGKRLDIADYRRWLAPIRGDAGRKRLRPLIRRALLRGSDNSADADLIMRLLRRGARLWWYPEVTYFSRHAGPVPRHPSSGVRDVCFISKQRVVGSTNGSSTYLLGLAAAIAAQGIRVHLVCPSPAVFGRWPGFILRPEMAVFQTIAIRGSCRFGKLVIAANPLVALTALGSIIGRLLTKARLPVPWLDKPAPYSIRVKLTAKDFLFLALHARRCADMIIADYAFMTEGIPYVLRPDAPSAVIMHDLLSSRGAEFGPLGATGAEAVIDCATEMSLLGKADTIVAIQSDEAAVVRYHLPRHEVIVAPFAAVPVKEAQPGEGAQLLFVGSKTTANIHGLQWFIDEVWPTVSQAVPSATLLVAGTVGELFTTMPSGIRLLGRVADLTPLYQVASVVISPLHGGSGLKIKLIEAMAYGKAIVATTVTLQGVEDIVRPAILVADDAVTFSAAVVALLGDAQLRLRHAEAALHLARTQFSAAACYGDLLAFVSRTR